MSNIDNILRGILEETIDVASLTVEEIDGVILKLREYSESHLNGEHHAMAVEILSILEPMVQFIEEDMLLQHDIDFEKAILDAEARGSVYWEAVQERLH